MVWLPRSLIADSVERQATDIGKGVLDAFDEHVKSATSRVRQATAPLQIQAPEPEPQQQQEQQSGFQLPSVASLAQEHGITLPGGDSGTTGYSDAGGLGGLPGRARGGLMGYTGDDTGGGVGDYGGAVLPDTPGAGDHGIDGGQSAGGFRLPTFQELAPPDLFPHYQDQQQPLSQDSTILGRATAADVPTGGTTPVYRGPQAAAPGGYAGVAPDAPVTRDTVNQAAATALSRAGLPTAMSPYLAGIAINEGILQPGTIARDYWSVGGVKAPGSAGTVTVPTREVVNGQSVMEQGTFGKFGSMQEGMDGLAQFIRDSPRFGPIARQAAQTGDYAGMIAGFQGAGYATDPNWTRQVTSIASGLPVPSAAPAPAAPAAPQQTAALPPAGQTTSQNFQNIVDQWKGVPYVFGGPGGRSVQGVASTDCSGFISALTGLPAHTDAAYTELQRRGAVKVTDEQAKPGDIVVYMGGGTGGSFTHHIGMVAGPGQVLDMSTANGGGVQIRPITHGGKYEILRDPTDQRTPDPPPNAPPPAPIVPTGYESGGDAPDRMTVQDATVKGQAMRPLSFGYTRGAQVMPTDLQDMSGADVGTGGSSAASAAPAPPVRDDYRLTSPSSQDGGAAPAVSFPSSQPAAPPSANPWHRVGEALRDAITGAQDTAGGVASAVGGAVSGAGEAVGNALAPVGQALVGPPTFENAVPVQDRPLEQAVDELQARPREVASAVGQTIRNAPGAVWEGMNAVGRAVEPFTATGMAREQLGREQQIKEQSADEARIQQLYDMLDEAERTGDVITAEQIKAEILPIEQRLNAAYRESPITASERNPQTEPATTAINLGQGVVAGAIAPSLGAGLARNIAAAAIDPSGQAFGAGVEKGGSLIGRGARALRNAGPTLSNAAVGGLGAAAFPGLDAEGNPIELTPEERLRNIALGAAAGAVSGHLMGRSLADTLTGGLARRGLAASGVVPSGGGPARGGADPQKYPELARLERSMQEALQTPAPPGGRPIPSAFERIRQGAVRRLTDSGVTMDEIQRDIARGGGTTPAKLATDDRISAIQRLSPDNAVQMQIQREIMDPLREIGNGRPNVSKIITLRQNIDQAREMGAKVEREFTSPAIDAAQKEVARLEALVNDARAPMDTPMQLDRARERLVTEQQSAQAAARQAGETAQARRMFSGGLNAADSQKALDDLREILGPEEYARAEAVADKITDFNRGTLDIYVQGHMVSPEQAEALNAQYPNYARTNIIKHLNTDGPGGVAVGKKFGVGDAPIDALTVEGTTAAKQDPIPASIAERYIAQRRVQQNKITGMFLETAQQDPELSQHIKEIIPLEQYKAQGNTLLEGQTLDVPRLGPDQGRIGWFDENATKHEYLVDDWAKPLVYGGQQSMGDLPFKAYQNFLQEWKKTVTSGSLSFTERNLPRDIRQGLNYLITLRGGPTPGNIMGASIDLANGYRDAFRGLGKGKFEGSTADLLSAGGFGGQGAWGKGLEAQELGVDEIARTGGMKIRNAKDLLDAITDPIQAFNSRAELGPRSAAFKYGIGKGMSPTEAAILANDYMPYEVAGDWTRMLNKYVPFLSARVAGLQSQVRLAKQHPKAYLATALATTTAPAIAAQMWNRSDEDRSKAYDDVPSYVKYLGDVIMMPWAGKDTYGMPLPNYVFIPTGTVGPFSWLGHGIADAIMGKGVDPADAKDMLGALGQTLSPVDVQSGALMSQLLGPVAGTAEGLRTNRDVFRGTTIASRQNDLEASRFGQAVAGGINAVGQRVPLVGQDVNVHPSQVDYLTRGLGGYPGSALLGASDIGRERPGEASNIQDIPGLGGLISPLVGNRTGGVFGQEAGRTTSGVAGQVLRDAGVQWRPAPVDDMLRGVPLTRTERGEVQRDANDLFEASVADISFDDPRWANATPAQRETTLKNRWEAAVAGAENRLVQRYPDRFTRPEAIRRAQIEQQRKAG